MRIAIDPGSAGGIVAEFNDGVINTYKMPDTDLGIIELFKMFQEKANTNKVSSIMEKVTGYIGGREVEKKMVCPHCLKDIHYIEKQADPASTMFNFGDGNGFLRACCLMSGFRYETVPPRTWQTCFGLKRERYMSKTAWKNLLKDKAQKLYPSIKVTLFIADALIILEYSKRIAQTYFLPKINN